MRAPGSPKKAELATMTDVINDLRKQGYDKDLNLRMNRLHCAGLETELSPEDFEVDETYRFEGETDPADEAIVYAISSEKFHLKGILVNAYGVYSDPMVDKMAQKLNIARTLHNDDKIRP